MAHLSSVPCFLGSNKQELLVSSLLWTASFIHAFGVVSTMRGTLLSHGGTAAFFPLERIAGAFGDRAYGRSINRRHSTRLGLFQRPTVLRSPQDDYRQNPKVRTVGRERRPWAVRVSQPTRHLFALKSQSDEHNRDPGGKESDLMTVGKLMSQSIQRLEDSGVDEADESVFHMLAHVLDLSWENGFRELREAYRHPRPSSGGILDRWLTLPEREEWHSFLERRLRHEPVQYILGQWDFLDYTFRIQRPLLCPRPETEELVLLVSQSLQKLMTSKTSSDDALIRVLDVGCGTGCIGVSLAAMHDNVHVTALDIDPTAISVSQENAQRILGTEEAKRRYSAQLVAAADFEGHPFFDLVVSNPPYIPPDEMKTLDATVIQYESHAALCGGLETDGMRVIRDIVRALPRWCRSGAPCWMEVHPTHPQMLQEWLSKSTRSFQRPETDLETSKTPVRETSASTLGVSFVQSVRDFQGKDRFVQLQVT